jgi:hypothetical protein
MSAKTLLQVVTHLQSTSPRDDTVDKVYERMRKTLEELESVFDEVDEFYDGPVGSASGESIESDPYERLKFLDANLDLYERIFGQVEKRLAYMTADLLSAQTVGADTTALQNKIGEYTIFRAKLQNFIRGLLQQRREKALIRIERQPAISALRERLSSERRKLAEDALLAAARAARTSGIYPIMADKLRGVIKPDEDVKRELMPVADFDDLEDVLFSTGGSEEVFIRRTLDLPQSNPHDYLVDCVIYGYKNCVSRIMQTNPSRKTISEAFTSTSDADMLHLLVSTGFVPNGEEILGYLNDDLNYYYHNGTNNISHYYHEGSIGVSRISLWLLAKYGDALSLADIKHVVIKNEQTFLSDVVTHLERGKKLYTDRFVKLHLALYSLPEIQADVTQFPIHNLFVPVPWFVSVGFDVTFQDFVREMLTDEGILGARGAELTIDEQLTEDIERNPDLVTADVIRRYMRMLASAAEIDL